MTMRDEWNAAFRDRGEEPPPHTCHAKGCTLPVKPEMLMCKGHWFMVPKVLRDAVWCSYRVGQCDDMNPSREWLKAAEAAIAYVAAREGKMTTVTKCRSCGGPISWVMGKCSRCGKEALPPPEAMHGACDGDGGSDFDPLPELPPLPALPPLIQAAAEQAINRKLDAIAAAAPFDALPPLPALPALPPLPDLTLGGLLSQPNGPPIWKPIAPQLIPARLLVVDPPWKFGDKLPGGGRGAEKHYKVLTLDEIKAFAIPPLADNAILFLWRVGAMVEEAYAVARAWGFTPKSEITWQKVRVCKHCSGTGFTARTLAGEIGVKTWCEPCKGRGRIILAGMGRYTRRATETCIIAIRGKPTACMPEAKDQIDTFEAPRTEHSEKPDRFFEIVERMYPSGPYVELFARKRRPGWIQYGDELPADGVAP